MKRDIDRALVEWAQSDMHKPLLITGVRQCGKTYAMKMLGQTEFGGDFAYFNLERNARARETFETDLDPVRILDELSALHGKAIIPGQTLLILDEIQACKPAITSLKYFREETPKLHVACAGSLLGVMFDYKHEPISFPVGQVDRMRMYPMSFKEFLEAINPNFFNLFEYRYAHGSPLDSFSMRPLETALRMYYIIGGMPDAVSKWLSTKDISQVEAVQDTILNDYEDDFGKHAKNPDIPKIKLIWASLPVQLAKDNNKFMFSHVKEGKTARDLEDALGWLAAAGLVHKLHLVENPLMPLAHKASAVDFKLYMSDVGLLRRKTGVTARSILLDDDGFKPFKGAFIENFVMQELLSLGKKPYYWRSSNQAEVDFLLEEGGRLVPLEAKASIHTKAKSFKVFAEAYQPLYGFKFSLKNVGDHMVANTHTYSIPLYLIWKINDWIKLEQSKEPVCDMAAIYDEFLNIDGLIDDARGRYDSDGGPGGGPTAGGPVKPEGPELT